MTMTDPIADLLTRIRNAGLSSKTMVRAPYSKMKMSICEVLKAGSFIADVSKTGEGINQEILIELREDRKDLHLKSVSKPGQRIYVRYNEIPRVLNGLGIAVVSTSRGIMNGDEARKQKLGGEFICEIY